LWYAILVTRDALARDIRFGYWNAARNLGADRVKGHAKGGAARSRNCAIRVATTATLIAIFSQASLADEGGVSYWLPGTFGSLAAVPGQPGWSFAAFYWHDSVSAGADVARSREIQFGRFNPTLNVNLNANLNSTIDMR
jgi:hypothetical protein